MLHVDARKLTPSVQQALRRQAIRLRTQGMTYAEIAAVVGVHPTTVCQWYEAFERDGEAAFGGGKRGRAVEPGAGGSHPRADHRQAARKVNRFGTRVEDDGGLAELTGELPWPGWRRRR